MTTARFLDMYVGFGSCHHERQQQHWVLILAPQGSTNCTFYHVKRGPMGYQHCLESGQLLTDPRLASLDHIGVIPAVDQKLVYDISRLFPAERCHWYIVSVLEELEAIGILYKGTAQYYYALVPDSMFEESVGVDDIDDFSAMGELLQWRDFAEDMGWSNLFFDTCYF
ncbi:hypothetical protein BDV12DRAFT_201602 [Aspergillus spectabilis]